MVFNFNKGNLVVNGSFEQGFAGWSGIDNVGLEGSALSHEGLIVAAMGKPNNLLDAVIFQDVCIVPRRAFFLRFFVSCVAPNSADLTVDVLWLDRYGNIISSALTAPIVVPGITTGSAGKGGYKAVVSYTECAPASAAAARLLFQKAPGTVEDNFLLLDTVIFAEQ